MSQPVKLSDELVLDARVMGETAARSIAGQIEFWAKLGRAVDPLLRGREVTALLRAGQEARLSQRLETIDTNEGHRRVLEYLERQPYPHYESSPEVPGLLVRIDADGTRTLGRFLNRKFVPAS